MQREERKKGPQRQEEEAKQRAEIALILEGHNLPLSDGDCNTKVPNKQ